MSKYILALKMPTGRRWVLGSREGGIALLPVEDNLLIMKDIFAFDEIEDANKWIAEVSNDSPTVSDLLAQVTILHSDEAIILKQGIQNEKAMD